MRRILPLALALALIAAPAAADFGAGQRDFLAGDYAAALGHWRPLAEAGDPAAQYALGVLHDRGLGVALDPAAARRWFEAAAGQGYQPALAITRRPAVAAGSERKAADDGKAANNASTEAGIRLAIDRMFAELSRSGLWSYASLRSDRLAANQAFTLADLRLRNASGLELRLGDVAGELRPAGQNDPLERIDLKLPEAMAGRYGDGATFVFKAREGRLNYARDPKLDLVTRLALSWQDVAVSDGSKGEIRAGALGFVSELKEEQAGRWHGVLALSLRDGRLDCGCGSEVRLDQLTLALEARALRLGAYRSLLHGAAYQQARQPLTAERPLGGLALELGLGNLRVKQPGVADFGLERAHLRLGLEDLDKAAGRLRLEVGHDGLTSSDAALPLATASDLALVLDRLPVERLTLMAIGIGMQAALTGSLDVGGPLFGQLLGELSATGTEFRVERGQVSYGGAKARLEGLLQADSEAALGASGGFNLSVDGLQTLVKTYEKAANAASGLTPWLALAPLLAGMADPASADGSHAFRLGLKRDGALLLDGADLLPMLRSLFAASRLAAR